MLTGTPFEDLQAVIGQMPPPDDCAGKKIAQAVERKALPETSGLIDLVHWLGVWQGKSQPRVTEAHICVLASSYRHEESHTVLEYIDAVSKGAAPVNLLCVDKGIGLRAIQLAPELPHDATADWPEAECMGAVAFGMEASASGGDLLGLSDMAPGNAAHAVALVMATQCDDLDADDVKRLAPDVACAANALRAEKEKGTNPSGLEVLRLYGGREIAAAVGAMIAARSRRLPMIADGWAALAAVSVLEACKPGSTAHVRPAAFDCDLQGYLWRVLGKEPLIGVLVGGGAGCGAAIAVSLLDAACNMLELRER